MPNETEIEKFNRRMGLRNIDTSGLDFIKIPDKRFELSGFPWYSSEHCFRRLPQKPQENIPADVDSLAWHTSGGSLRFSTDSRRILIKAVRANWEIGDNMSPLGTSGFDLYKGEPGNERFMHVTRSHPAEKEITSQLFYSSDSKMRTFTIYFPLYRGVESIEIGINQGASVTLPTPLKGTANGIAVYGTSITQGGCASRPGLSYTNILSRKLGRHFVNLGFSGAGRGEPELASAIADLHDASLFLLDFEPNAGASFIERLPPFIQIIRKKHPNTPILVLSRYPYSDNYPTPEHVQCIRRALDAMGDDNLYFQDGTNILGKDYCECLVDGVHANDAAFMKMADALSPVISVLLKS